MSATQMQNAFGVTQDQFHAMTLSQQTELIGAPPSITSNTPVYDAAGYDQNGYNASGYSIYGINQYGDVDPSIADQGGKTNTDTMSDGSRVTVVIAKDGSSTETLNNADGMVYIYNSDASGDIIRTTTQSSDGTILAQSIDPSTGIVTQNVTTGSGVVEEKATIQKSQDGSASAISTIYNSWGQQEITESDRKTSDGSSTRTEINYSDNAVQGHVVIYNSATDKATSVSVTGTGNTVDLNGATITLSAGAQATISGSNNNSTGDTNSSVNLTSGSSWDVVTMMKSGEVVLASADDDITVHASNSYVSMGVEDRVAIDGSTTNVTGGIDNTVTTQGSGENVTLGTGSTLVMTGTNDEANLSNGTVWLGANTTPGASPVGDCAGRRRAGNRSADSQPRYRLCSSGAGRRNQAGCLSVYPLRHHRRQGHVDFAGRGQGRQVGVGLSGTDTTGRTFDCGGWQKYSAGTGDVEFGGDQDRATADY
ncbi:hypothetical protein POF45_04080 [Pseudomonas sp. 681]|uniref:Uncharacterized protein n=1 Tax=Pseudomonas fungipugnans TaxID=3024217 RepID=A0ABT6QK35_9PSED|nr:hypothetical protein [Pseudomonas sp. 681]MDI2590612.1 hypothetical protein [Pseudomonas sp. 681]